MAKHGKKTLGERIASFFKPVQRLRKAQVNRQIDIDVQKRPAMSTFRRSSTEENPILTGAARDVEAARRGLRPTNRSAAKRKKERKPRFGKSTGSFHKS